MPRTFAPLIIAALLAPTAFAQVFVVGGGMAAECYDAAKSGSTRLSAETICTQALRSEVLTRGNRAATYTNRGVIRMRDGDYDGALEDYSKAETIDGDQGAIHLNRGAALIYMKQFGEAIAPLNRAIELETQDLYAAHYNRAIAKENTGDIAGAYADFTTALELKPEWDIAERQLSRFSVN